MSDCKHTKLRCRQCLRDFDPKDIEHWHEPVQLELDIPEPEEPEWMRVYIKSSDVPPKGLVNSLATKVGGFFNSRDIPAI